MGKRIPKVYPIARFYEEAPPQGKNPFSPISPQAAEKVSATVSWLTKIRSLNITCIYYSTSRGFLNQTPLAQFPLLGENKGYNLVLFFSGRSVNSTAKMVCWFSRGSWRTILPLELIAFSGRDKST